MATSATPPRHEDKLLWLHRFVKLADQVSGRRRWIGDRARILATLDGLSKQAFTPPEDDRRHWLVKLVATYFPPPGRGREEDSGNVPT